MNIFIIPSWYPSPQHPYAGIFFREQAESFAQYFQEDNIGISHWGQNDERFLLWSKDRLKNLRKLYSSEKTPSSRNELKPNCIEYFKPAFTWTRKILKGNINSILKSNLNNLKSFEKEFGKANILLAHVSYPAGFIAHKISLKKNIPYIIVEHMSPFPFMDFLDKKGNLIPQLKMAYTNSNSLMAVSKGLKSKMERYIGYPVSVLNNFIDDQSFIPLKRPTDSQNLKLLSVGRLEHQKGYDILIKSIAQLDISYLSLELIGIGSEENALMDLANNLRLAEVLSIRGEMDKNEIIKALQKCDLFILSSRHESFGVVVLEALACGKPCIVTTCGGPEEIISEEVGLVVEKENPKALAEAIVYMVENIEKYPPKKIRKYYEDHFSARETVKKLKGIYQNVIDEYSLKT